MRIKLFLLVVSLPSLYKHFKEILLYSNNDTLSFEDIKASLLSKPEFDLEARSNDKANGINVRSRPFGKEGTNRKNSHSKCRGRKSNKFCKHCKKQGHLVDERCSLKSKKEKDENNKQP